MIDSYHRGEPPILELSEVPDVFGDLSMPGRNSMMAKEPELNFADFSEKFSKGIAEFTGAFFQPVFKFLNEWASSMSKGLIDKNIEILEILVELKNNISTEIGQLQSWFKFQLNDQLRNIDIFIDDQLENLTKMKGDVVEKIEGIEKIIQNKLAMAFTEALGATISNLTKNIDEVVTKLKAAVEKSSPIVDKVTKNNNVLSQSIQDFTSQIDGLKKSTGNLAGSVENTLNITLGALNRDLDAISNQQRDFIDSLKALKSMANNL